MRYLGGLLSLGLLALIAASCVPVSRLSHTCVTCRLTRLDATCLGLTRSTYHENECSRWYAGPRRAHARSPLGKGHLLLHEQPAGHAAERRLSPRPLPDPAPRCR